MVHITIISYNETYFYFFNCLTFLIYLYATFLDLIFFEVYQFLLFDDTVWTYETVKFSSFCDDHISLTNSLAFES